MYRRILVPITLSLLLSLLGACAGNAPLQIATFPKITPIAKYPPVENIVYRAYIEVMVNDVDGAADQASRLAYSYGGYPTSSQSWYVDGRKVTSIELAVPTPYFEGLRHDLLKLGDMVNENYSGQAIPETPYYSPPPFASISLQLRSRGIKWTPIETGGWSPRRTFERAFAVFVGIFGFLADVLIWIMVVGGPFILIGLGGWALARRLRRP
jgi:hypothetical protein